MSKGLRIAVFIGFIMLLLWGAARLSPIIAPLFMALLLTYILQPAVEMLERLDVRTGIAIIVVYAYFFIVLALLFSLCLPILVSQFYSLLQAVPGLVERIHQSFVHVADQAGSYLLRDLADLLYDNAEAALSGKLTAMLNDTKETVSALTRTILYLVLAPFLGFYLLRDKGSLRRALAAWIPIGERTELRRLSADVDHLLRQFLRGYLLVATAVALLSAAFYSAIDLDYPLALGLIMGIADIIPYFGPIIGAVPAVAVALSEGASTALVTGVGLLVIQQMESLIITPLVMGDKVGLHPLTTIMSVLAGGWLFGVLGAVLAVPAVAAGLLIIRYLWSRAVGAKVA